MNPPRAPGANGDQTVIEYLDREIERFDRDPADSDLQRGYLEALKTVRSDCFGDDVERFAARQSWEF